jgi:peptide/nickel transport system substrate-binding protein
MLKSLEGYIGWQVLQRWGYTKLPLWTKAKYGGWGVGSQYTFVANSFKLLTVQVLNRPSMAGMLLYADSGRCSLEGCESDFSVCNGKYARNNGYTIIPGIFQKWEQPDPLTYIFTVRKGVLWPATPPMARTDREVTAEDVVFFLTVTKREGITRSNFTLVKEFQAMDRYTVKITMTSPNADFLLNLVHTSQGIFPRECYEQKDCLGEIKSVSPGPFLVKEHEVRNKLVMERNPEFYLKGLPYWDGYIVVNITDPAALQSAFLTGQSDYWNAQSVSQAEEMLKRRPAAQVQAIGGIGAVTGALRPQYTGALADVRVRRAMAMTMDHRSMWQAGYEGFSLLTPLIGRQYFGDDFYMPIEQAGENYQLNPEKAKQLMIEAGYPNGFSTLVTTTASSGYSYDYVLFLQSQWKKYLGIDLKIVVSDFATVTLNYQKGAWEGCLGTTCCWIPQCWATADDVFAQFIQGSPLNVQKVNDPKIDQMYLQQRGELDPAKRAKLLWEFDEYERQMVYEFRTGFCSYIGFMQPWEMNGASHGTMYFTAYNGPTWLGMHDVAKYPSGR